jgi:hypothetical protein
MGRGRRRGRRIVVWAFDPAPDQGVVEGLRPVLKRAGVDGFSTNPPNDVRVEGLDVKSVRLDPSRLSRRGRFERQAGIEKGLFADDRRVAAAAVELGPRKPSRLLLRFDHSNLDKGTAVVLHGAQWDEAGRPEGGMTVVAVAPTDR